jgi:hypothetical protein
MPFNLNTAPEEVPDDQAYDVPEALNNKAKLLTAKSLQHDNRADILEESGVSEDLVTEERSKALENLAQIVRLKFAASIFKRTSKKDT